ncbi:hypothetical protein F0562_013361 [Nyssa sinensis]|uniref:ABC transporter domain-containing protein n=1 Tax=Nyssa sinensis TaxID=561372 RepID=A0A5J4ZKJ6_9ASTE|nr:hypothetical protein F0562_013361 [Nyssa sinensis]
MVIRRFEVPLWLEGPKSFMAGNRSEQWPQRAVPEKDLEGGEEVHAPGMRAKVGGSLRGRVGGVRWDQMASLHRHFNFEKERYRGSTRGRAPNLGWTNFNGPEEGSNKWAEGQGYAGDKGKGVDYNSGVKVGLDRIGQRKGKRAFKSRLEPNQACSLVPMNVVGQDANTSLVNSGQVVIKCTTSPRNQGLLYQAQTMLVSMVPVRRQDTKKIEVAGEGTFGGIRDVVEAQGLLCKGSPRNLDSAADPSRAGDNDDLSLHEFQREMDCLVNEELTSEGEDPSQTETNHTERINRWLDVATAGDRQIVINNLSFTKEPLLCTLLAIVGPGQGQPEMSEWVLRKIRGPADIYLIDEPSAYLDSEQRIVASKVIKRQGHCLRGEGISGLYCKCASVIIDWNESFFISSGHHI